MKQINLLENELEKALYEREKYKAELKKYIAKYGPLPPATSRKGFQIEFYFSDDFI